MLKNVYYLKISKKFDQYLIWGQNLFNERKTRIETLIKLKILFTENPPLSLRKASVYVGISYYFCRDILHKNLRLKPYKYQSVHQLLLLDYEKRFFFAQWWLDLTKSAYK